jgi:acyl-CoA synthetase (AMP-forming)/AMP-acid ligase II
MGDPTFGRLLQRRAAHDPVGPAYTYLVDDGPTELAVSYSDLLARARNVAQALTYHARPGDRAALLLRPGIDFVVALMACFLTGVVAVPAFPPPRPAQARRHPRLRAIWADASPSVVLTGAPPFRHDGPGQAEPWDEVPSIRVDTIGATGETTWTGTDVEPGAVALLQYTSGSAGHPKGVALSQQNLMANCAALAAKSRPRNDDVGVMWVPPYHDMGLVGGILKPLFACFPVVLMSPVAFLQRPVRWLEAISRYRATMSAAPNFALDLCAQQVEMSGLKSVDLSSMRLLYVGAEPVRPATLDRFATALAPLGFRKRALYPCYGLAEATLFVTGGPPDRDPVVRQIGGRPLVGCGSPPPGHQMFVIDPESGRRCPNGVPGEVWVLGDSVATGYWGNPQATAVTFPRTPTILVDEKGDTRCVRTADEGVVVDGELFLTGRMSEVVIIRGRKVHPEDIESSAARVVPDLGRSAAFGIDDGRREHLVVVQAVGREVHGGQVVGDILQAVSEDFDLQPSAVVLIRTRQLPLTTSGKVQRAACRDAYLSGQLEILHEWSSPHWRAARSLSGATSAEWAADR